MNKLSASILGQDNKVELVNKIIDKGITQIHYDVMDGTFIPNRHSLPAKQIKDIVSKTKKHIVDIHFMTNNPRARILEVADIADYVTFHYESESIDEIKKLYKKLYGLTNIGISIKPSTNIEQIYEFLFDSTHVLIMSVVPGKGGQSFMPEVLDKVRKLRKYIDDRKLNVTIQIDGGINLETMKLAQEAGVDSFVSGSYLINNIDNEKIIKEMI